MTHSLTYSRVAGSFTSMAQVGEWAVHGTYQLDAGVYVCTCVCVCVSACVCVCVCVCVYVYVCI